MKNDNSWEIVRCCSAINTTVVGGVKKLFSEFFILHSPEKVFCTCDMNKFSGESLISIDFEEVGITSPDVYDWAHGKQNKQNNEMPIAHIYGAGGLKLLCTR